MNAVALYKTEKQLEPNAKRISEICQNRKIDVIVLNDDTNQKGEFCKINAWNMTQYEKVIVMDDSKLVCYNHVPVKISFRYVLLGELLPAVQ